MELLGQKRTDILKARSENHTAQLSICLKLVPLVKKLNLWTKLASKHSAQLSFLLKLATFFRKVKIIQNTAHNCKLN